MNREYFLKESDFWREEIERHLTPFWLKHARDRQYGGYFGGLRRDGSVFDPHKSSSWTMGRNVWAFGYIYNWLSQERDWLEYLRHGVEFMKKFSLDENGRTWGALTRDGRPLARATDVYHDLYTAQAFTQAAKATGETGLLETARRLAYTIAEITFNPRLNPFRPYFSDVIPWSSHPEHLILLETFQYLREVEPDPDYEAVIDQILANIFTLHYQEDQDAVIEVVGLDEPLAPWHAAWVTPGHMFELSWMVINEARRRSDAGLLNKGLKVCDWGWRWGWDTRFGGVRNTVSITNEYWIPGFMGHMDPIGPFKNWWACCEAIHANLLCYCVSGEERYLQRYEIARDWAIAHYADREYGEWFGVLSEDGRLIDGGAKATDIKMCQHTIRTAYFCSLYAARQAEQPEA